MEEEIDQITQTNDLHYSTTPDHEKALSNASGRNESFQQFSRIMMSLMRQQESQDGSGKRQPDAEKEAALFRQL